MTVTNYQGEARAYLEKLIEACGATFTRNMTSSNTHLIAARLLFRFIALTSSKIGEKCKHAHDWGIDVVNHLWLEETYAKWQVQPVTIPRYTHFPPQTNLTEIIDKTQIQEEGILDFFNPQEDEDDEVISGNPDASTTTKSQDVQSSYIQAEKKTPAPASHKVFHSDPKSRGPETPAQQTTPTQTPSSSRRKAAENAMTKLHNEIMPDVLLWQKEKNRKRIPEESPIYSKEHEKRKAEKRKIEEKENFVDGVVKKSKKDIESGKEVFETSSKIVLLVTGSVEDFASGTGLKVPSSRQEASNS